MRGDRSLPGGTLAALMVSLVLLALVLSGVAFMRSQTPGPPRGDDQDPMLAALDQAA